MGASSKRLGISDSPEELEFRLQRIETELLVRQFSNFESSASARVRSGNPIDQVVGLSADVVPGAIALRWNPVLNPDLFRYEVQISDNAGFPPGTTTTTELTNEASFILDNVDLDVERFVRVRAVNHSEEPGLYSATLNTRTGLATPNNLEIGAAHILAADILEAPGFFPPSVTTNFGGPGVETVTQVWGGVAIETVGALVASYVLLQINIVSGYSAGAPETNRIQIDLLRDGRAIDTANIDVFSPSTVGGNQYTITGLGSFDDPPPGRHVYQVRYTISSDRSTLNFITLTPESQIIELVEYRR